MIDRSDRRNTFTTSVLLWHFSYTSEDLDYLDIHQASRIGMNGSSLSHTILSCAMQSFHFARSENTSTHMPAKWPLFQLRLVRSSAAHKRDRWISVPYSSSFQSHTVLRNRCISTLLLFISTIHGCSSIRHGVARRLGSFSRLQISLAFPPTYNPIGCTLLTSTQ